MYMVIFDMSIIYFLIGLKYDNNGFILSNLSNTLS